jgi:hypothetical protein
MQVVSLPTIYRRGREFAALGRKLLREIPENFLHCHPMVMRGASATQAPALHGSIRSKLAGSMGRIGQLAAATT